MHKESCTAMYLSLNPTITAGRAGWPLLAEIAAGAGFPAVDVTLGSAYKEGTEPTRALLKRLKLRAGVVPFPVEFRKDDATFEQSLKGLEEAARFAVALDCPRMATWIMSSSELPKAEQREIYLRRFRKAADILARVHVRLALEFLGPVHLRKRFPHEFIWQMNEMTQFTADCGPNVGLLLDSWHWHHAGATANDILAAGKDRLVHIHISDAAQMPPEKVLDNERLMPGEGVIDFAAFFGALKKAGYRDAVSVEVFGRGLKDMTPEAGAKLALETSAAVMKKAGVL